MEDKLKILEEQIKALKELISIKEQTINELKSKPLNPIQYIPYYIQPQIIPQYQNPYYNNPWWGNGIYSIGTNAITNCQGQLGAQSGQNYYGFAQGQIGQNYCSGNTQVIPNDFQITGNIVNIK